MSSINSSIPPVKALAEALKYWQYNSEEKGTTHLGSRREDEVKHEFSALMHTILIWYHDEQVRLDKIRMSTYRQLCMNIPMLVLAIIVMELWKRRRLMQAFEPYFVPRPIE
jgi:hypothetical protein